MVHRDTRRWGVAVLALGWALPAGAASTATTTSTDPGSSIFSAFKTGDVEKDLPASSAVTIVPGRGENSVAQPTWMTQEGLINGYVMKDIRLSYDQKTDTLAVGVNFWGIAGNADDSPDGSTNPKTAALGGSNPAHIGGDKSIAIGFTPVTTSGTSAPPLILAGVPAIKTGTPSNTVDNFTVASYTASPSGITRSFGATMTSNVGNLAYDPSQAHPDFEFTIKNFSKIPGLNALANGFYIQAYAGTGSYTTIGKSEIFDTLVKLPTPSQGNLNNTPTGTVPTGSVTVNVPPPRVPEPATILAWGLVVGGGALRLRHRLRLSRQV